MARLELLTVLIAIKALLGTSPDKTVELINGLLDAVKKLPPGQKLELITVLFAVKTLLENGSSDKSAALIDEILDTLKNNRQEDKGE